MELTLIGQIGVLSGQAEARELWKTKVYQSPNKESSHTLPLTFMTGWNEIFWLCRSGSNSQLNMMPQINLGPGELVAERRKDLTLRTPEEACERDIKWIPPMARNSWTRKGRPDITYARKTWNTSQLRAMKWIMKITQKSLTFWITACGTSHKERRRKAVESAPAMWRFWVSFPKESEEEDTYPKASKAS